ncbi:MAG: UbiA family prenyltransferase [Promethearchaeota archaeon]
MTHSAFTIIKVSRPLGWLVAPLVFLLGLTAFGSPLTPLAFIQVILLSVPYCVLLYGTNDRYDYEADKLNPRKPARDSVEMETRVFPLIKTLTLIVTFLLMLSAGLTLNPTNIFAMGILIFFSYFYSAPPLRFKQWPPMDSVSNGILYFYAPVLLGASFGAMIFQIPIQVYFISGAVMGIHSFSTIMDHNADKLVGERTFATVYGKRVAALFTLGMFFIAYFFSGFQGTIVGYYLLFCVVLAALIAVVPSEKWAKYCFYTIGIGFGVVAVFEVFRYLMYFY